MPPPCGKNFELFSPSRPGHLMAVFSPLQNLCVISNNNIIIPASTHLKTSRKFIPIGMGFIWLEIFSFKNHS